MKCCEYEPYTPVFPNPYPDQPPAQIANFSYETPLHLCRCKKALQLNAGEDADYVVSQPYTVKFMLDGVTHEITVPEGMLTDLSSVPWFARWLIGRVGPHLEASIVHDFLYIAWQDLEGYNAREQDREFADRLLYVAIKELGFCRLRRWVVRYGLKWFAGDAFWGPNQLRYVKDKCDDVEGG